MRRGHFAQAANQQRRHGKQAAFHGDRHANRQTGANQRTQTQTSGQCQWVNSCKSAKRLLMARYSAKANACAQNITLVAIPIPATPSSKT